MLIETLAASRDSDVLVIDRENRLEGLVSFGDIRSIIARRDLDSLITASDLVHRDVETVEPGTSLDQVMAAFNIRGANVVPVVESTTRKVVGIIRRRSLTEFYNHKLVEKLWG